MDGRVRTGHILMVSRGVLGPSWASPSSFLLNIYLKEFFWKKQTPTKKEFFFSVGEMIGKVIMSQLLAHFEGVRGPPDARGLCAQ